MNTDFQKTFDQIESQRSKILSIVSSCDPEFLNASPRAGKWSIMQILSHVMTAEELSIGYMQKKALGIKDTKNSGVVESIKLLTLNMIQRAPLKYNAPKVVVKSTPPSLSLPELIARWDENRRNLRKLLESIPENYTKRLIYKHVIVGRLNALQALHFFREHCNHHLPQIHAILKTKSEHTVNS